MLFPIANKRVVKVIYTNHANVTSERNIIPKRVWYGSTQWHSDQWLLEVYDVDKRQIRHFAMRDIKEWT